jgi:DNA-binding MarR family transcriptional regulator
MLGVRCGAIVTRVTMAPEFDFPAGDKDTAIGYTSLMKSFEQSIKAPLRPVSRSVSPTAVSCAALLLETAPRVLRAVRMAIAALESPALTIPQFRALHYIQDHPGASLSATAEFLGLTLPSTSKLVDQLVRRGMFARVDAAEDRRRMILRITPKGDALLSSAQSLVRQHLAGMLNRLGSAELAALHNTLGLLEESFPSHRGPVFPSEIAGQNGRESQPCEPRRRALKTLAARGVTFE